MLFNTLFFMLIREGNKFTTRFCLDFCFCFETDYEICILSLPKSERVWIDQFVSVLFIHLWICKCYFYACINIFIWIVGMWWANFHITYNSTAITLWDKYFIGTQPPNTYRINIASFDLIEQFWLVENGWWGCEYGMAW